MKIKFKDDSIFTTTGRINRRIKKIDKSLELISKIYSMVDEINKKLDNIDNSANSELPISENSTVTENTKNSSIVKEYEDSYLDNEEPNVIKLKRCTSNNFKKQTKKEISNNILPNISHSDIIKDEEVIKATGAAIKSKTKDDIMGRLSYLGIEMENCGNLCGGMYSSKSNNVSFSCDEPKEGIEELSVFIIRTKINPIIFKSRHIYKNDISIYNKILNELNIEKADPKFKSISSNGKACIIKLGEDNKDLGVCNISVFNNELILTIMYNVDEK